MNIKEFQNLKNTQQKISMLTCYDYWSARLLDQTELHAILVGDSAAMVMHGHNSTLPASVELMELHTASVVRGAPSKLIVADLPFLSYRKSLSESMTAIERLMKTGAHAVKLEGLRGNEELIRHCVDSGVPVMGHIGLTPQSIHQLGGFKVQARTRDEAQIFLESALKLEELGCFSVVFECVPSAIAQTATQKMKIPTIGIGAGLDTDGQILVLQDMLGCNSEFKPKFLRCFAQLDQYLKTAVQSYHQSVSEKQFPTVDESYE